MEAGHGSVYGDTRWDMDHWVEADPILVLAI